MGASIGQSRRTPYRKKKLEREMTEQNVGSENLYVKDNCDCNLLQLRKIVPMAYKSVALKSISEFSSKSKQFRGLYSREEPVLLALVPNFRYLEILIYMQRAPNISYWAAFRDTPTRSRTNQWQLKSTRLLTKPWASFSSHWMKMNHQRSTYFSHKPHWRI